MRVLDVNKSEKDILLWKEFDYYEEVSGGCLKIMYVLSYFIDDWEGFEGYVNVDIIKNNFFLLGDDIVCFFCGLLVMI